MKFLFFLVSDITKDVPSSLWQLMTAYISLALLGFCLVMLCLDKIGAKVEPEKSGYEVISRSRDILFKSLPNLL